MNRILIVSLLLMNGSILSGQTSDQSKPKLVVGIVVDQMRFDQLYKYEERYSEGGFKRILKEGFNFKNAHFNYTPTVTASGHASIYTGTTPSIHGIIGNSWYDQFNEIEVGNVNDITEVIIGSKEVNINGVSPRKLLSTTISDQLRLGSNFKSKVISVSLKDRGAILPGGHTANAAYWHDYQTSPGHFVSSSFYMDDLPDWVTSFNESGIANRYLDTVWVPLYPISSYSESDVDDSPFERILRGKSSPTFPYNFKEIRKIYRDLGVEYQMLWISPNGNTLLTDFAIEAIENESLGADSITDLINISYSVPDVVGHTFGLQSIELEDIYLRLDTEIERLLTYLDKTIGKDDYLLFLTSDHGAIQNAAFLNKHKLPTGIARINEYEKALRQHLRSEYGKKAFLLKFDYERVYLNRTLIAESGLELRSVQEEVADFLINLDGIRMALTASQLQNEEYKTGTRAQIQKGFHPKRAGDVLLAFEPGLIQNIDPELEITMVQGTTHGSGFAYDTHVPLVWKGTGIQKGESTRKVSITDIAPSLAMILNLQLPNGTTGIPLKELFK